MPRILKTRKQLKAEGQQALTELEQLKTPQGLADYLHSKREDDAFQDAVSARIFELRSQDQEAAAASEESAEGTA